MLSRTVGAGAGARTPAYPEDVAAASKSPSRSSSSSAPTGGGYRIVLAAVVGLAIGFFGSAISPFIGAMVGGILAIAGTVGYVQRAPWGAVVLTLGVALVAGAALYILIGIIQPDGASTGSGTAS